MKTLHSRRHMKTLYGWMSSVATGRCKKVYFVGNAVQASLRHANFIHDMNTCTCNLLKVSER